MKLTTKLLELMNKVSKIHNEYAMVFSCGAAG